MPALFRWKGIYKYLKGEVMHIECFAINEKPNPLAMLGRGGVVGTGEDINKSSCATMKLVLQAKFQA